MMKQLRVPRQALNAILGASVLVLAACGGGDGSNSLLGNGSPAPADPAARAELRTWQEGVYRDRSLYANFCANPRSGRDPFNDNLPYPDQQGTVEDEKFFLRSWTNDLYLWYDEVEDLNPNLPAPRNNNNAAAPEVIAYFDALKTDETTVTGRPKDNFHFAQDTAEYKTRTESGLVFGYGMDLVFGSTSPPRELIVQDVLPDSPAEVAGVQRGFRIVEIDGVDLINGDNVDALNRGLFPSVVGQVSEFVMTPFDGGERQTFSLRSDSIDTVPVKNATTFSTATGDVGYIHFNAHTFPSEEGLIKAFEDIAGTGVTDLILDLRYNGGGLLAIAAQAGYMIAGGPRTEGLTFYRTQFNDKYPNTDPVNNNRTIVPFPFIDESLGFVPADVTPGVSLPTLNLPRVFILSSGGTCSASEAIINGLRGADIEVFLIGSTTCGKPYGFYPQDNCGNTYFSVQFSGINEDGFGEYSDGFSPVNEPNAPGIPLPGCFVADDFSKALGDPTEGMVAAALQYREDGSCPAVPAAARAAVPLLLQKPSLGAEIRIPNEPGINNTIITPHHLNLQ